MRNRDPASLRSLAVLDLPSAHWHALEPVLEALCQRGFEFGTPVEKAGEWSCEYGPFRLAFGPRGPGWFVSMPVADDNAITRALLSTLDVALRKTPGVTTVGWYKREAPAGPPAASPIQP